MVSGFSYKAFGLLALQVVALPVEDNVAVRATAQNKTPIDAATYNDIVHYAPFSTAAAALQGGTCANTPYGTTIVDYFSINSTDTQAAIFRDDNAEEFILGIPGTNSNQDYLTDFTLVPVPYLAPNLECVGCLVHLGFYTAWSSITDDVSKALTANLAKYPSYKIIISGHSLGAALAQLAFAALKPQFTTALTQTYASGQPRVGNAAFADHIDDLSGATDTAPGIYKRVTHYNDGVPQLPPQILGFRHSRTEFWESTMSPAENTTFHCYGQEPADCNDSIGEMNVLQAINAAHSTYAGIRYSCA